MTNNLPIPPVIPPPVAPPRVLAPAADSTPAVVYVIQAAPASAAGSLTSTVRMVFGAICAAFLIGFCVVLFMVSENQQQQQPRGADHSGRLEPIAEARKVVSITEFTWSKGGFENLMMANFTITNGSRFKIKDLTIQCNHKAPSGTEIDRNVRTIYEVIEPGQTRVFENFNMGFIHSQASSSSAWIKDFKIAE